MKIISFGKKIIPTIISIIVHLPLSRALFLIGFRILLFVGSFLTAGIVTSILYVTINVIVGVVFHRFTKFKNFAIAFPIVGVLYAFLVGFLVYALISV